MSFPIDIESMLGPFGDPQTRRLAEEVIALRKQIALDRQSREASQAEFARLNRELNEERSRIGVLLDEIASAAIAAGMMDPARRGSLDGPNAIQFLRLITEQYEAMK
jgi:hypothetical protein